MLAFCEHFSCIRCARTSDNPSCEAFVLRIINSITIRHIKCLVETSTATVVVVVGAAEAEVY